jgi:hypothetical protein
MISKRGVEVERCSIATVAAVFDRTYWVYDRAKGL